MSSPVGRLVFLAGAALMASLIAAALQPAAAHDRSTSHSKWRQAGPAWVATLTMPAREATRLPDVAAGADYDSLAARFAAYAEPLVEVETANGRCAGAQARPLPARQGFLRIELRFTCAGGALRQITYRTLFDAAPSHAHFARLARPGGGFDEFLFTAERTVWRLQRPGDQTGDQMSQPAGAGTFVNFVELGAAHILSGLDHMAFLLMVLVAAGRLRAAIIAVTGFTLGHSLTLSAATLGWLRPDSAAIEAFIGLTIILVAADHVARATASHRPLAMTLAGFTALVGALAWGMAEASLNRLLAYLGMSLFAGAYLFLRDAQERGAAASQGPWTFALLTMLFGLIHGFGFAGFLLDTGLTGGDLIGPLLGFNLGVELGQLALVGGAGALIWIIGHFLRQRAIPALGNAPYLLTALLTALGTYWFIDRSFS